MPRKSSTLDEAVMLIQILTRIPKGRLITAQQLKQELDAAGIPIRIRLFFSLFSSFSLEFIVSFNNFISFAYSR